MATTHVIPILRAFIAPAVPIVTAVGAVMIFVLAFVYFDPPDVEKRPWLRGRGVSWALGDEESDNDVRRLAAGRAK